MNDYEKLCHNFIEIEQLINYCFKDKSLLSLAFIHRSYVNENKESVPHHNERLEFLGDSVLGVLIAEYLYRYLPSTPEGELSYLRSRLVEADSCVKYIQKLKIERYLLLGRGERMNDGRGRASIMADLFEALIGAIFIDGGLDAAKRFLFKNFSKDIESILQTPERNWKALLQDYTQKNFQEAPLYKVLSEEGPDHSKNFKIVVIVNGSEVGLGEGHSKKEAQQEAAKLALKHFGV